MNAKRTIGIISTAMVILALIGGYLLVRIKQEDHRRRMDDAAAQLQVILANGAAVTSQPAPGNEIRPLMTDAYGRNLLTDLAKAHDRFAIDPGTNAYVLVWNGPANKQLMYFDPGSQPGSGFTSGMLTQLTITRVQIKNSELIIWFTASSSAEEIKGLIGLEPREKYRIAIRIADLRGTDFIGIWRKATPLGNGDSNPEKAGDDKPATTPQPKPKDGEKAK